MIAMSGKTATELCAEYARYRAIKEANAKMVDSILDDVTDALFSIDQQAGYAFTKALGRDPDTDPAPFFGVAEETAKRRRN